MRQLSTNQSLSFAPEPDVDVGAAHQLSKPPTNRQVCTKLLVSTFLLSFGETEVSYLIGAARASPLRWESTLHAGHSNHRTIRSSTHEEGLCN